MTKKQAIPFKPMGKQLSTIAPNDLFQHLAGTESWQEIQSLAGFRHFVICKEELDKYLSRMEQRGETLNVLWTARPETALPFHTTDSAKEVLWHLEADSNGQEKLLMGALIETKNQYQVFFNRGASA